MKTPEQLLEALKILELPIPEHGEFYHSSTALILLNPYGASVRFSKKADAPLLRCDDLLRPIGSIDIDEDFRMDITAGGKLADYMDSVTVQDNLDAQGLESMDVLGHERNCLYLPKTETDAHKHGKPVCFDPLYIRPQQDSAARVYDAGVNGIYDLEPKSGETPDIQDGLYSDLRQSFKRAITAKLKTPEQDGLMSGFWGDMSEACANGRLVAAWNAKKTSANGHNITAISQQYESRLMNEHSLEVA